MTIEPKPRFEGDRVAQGNRCVGGVAPRSNAKVSFSFLPWYRAQTPNTDDPAIDGLGNLATPRSTPQTQIALLIGWMRNRESE
jgi:hypothetical protein